MTKPGTLSQKLPAPNNIFPLRDYEKHYPAKGPDNNWSDFLLPSWLNSSVVMADPAYATNALEQAYEHFRARNPGSENAHHNAHNHLPGGNTRTVLHAEPFPITWVRGMDATLVSIDGDVYTDLLGEFSAGIFGHSEARIADAVAKAMSGGWNFGGNSLVEKTFAAKVCERFGSSGIDLVRFTNSGTEANTTALAAAVAITSRRKIMVFSGGYHGSTLVFPMALMKGSTAPSMNLPHEFVFAPYNNIPETRSILNKIGPCNLAAVLVEPIQGSGGCRPATKEFLQYLRKVCDDTGALMVIDEVMASRLGVGGYVATQGVKGDIVTLGKYVGGGMTFGAFGGRKDIMERFDPSKGQLFHPGTYNNNVLSMSAGLAGLEIYNAAEVERLNKLGEDVKKRVQQVLVEEEIYPSTIADGLVDIVEIDSFEKDTSLEINGGSHNLEKLPPMFITGRGSMLNVRFSVPNSAVWQTLYYHHMLSKNIHVAVRGYTPLHLRVSQDHVSQYVSAIRDFVRLHKTQLCA
ncbi:putative acetylornithine aminotransferase [Rhexocercosporidium sp. MPI-PUGE-AT-0058]|nr:putative acetylornithine aminotransferase [Rhexocercosporidium sp. MPI-PUGE-AT-0058]